MNLAIVGSRDFDDYDLLEKVVNSLRKKIDIINIVSGGANGADKLAEKYAKLNNLTMIVHPADWDKHGKAAGYIRNTTIWNDSDIGIAFWDGSSKGTSHSFGLAKKQNKKLIIVNYKSNKIYLSE